MRDPTAMNAWALRVPRAEALQSLTVRLALGRTLATATAARGADLDDAYRQYMRWHRENGTVLRRLFVDARTPMRVYRSVVLYAPLAGPATSPYAAARSAMPGTGGCSAWCASWHSSRARR